MVEEFRYFEQVTPKHYMADFEHSKIEQQTDSFDACYHYVKVKLSYYFSHFH
jgi:hypothetical protein